MVLRLRQHNIGYTADGLILNYQQYNEDWKVPALT